MRQHDIVGNGGKAMEDHKMTDQEFERLKTDIETAMDRLDSLQNKYREQTGQTFVRPLRLLPNNLEKVVNNGKMHRLS